MSQFQGPNEFREAIRLIGAAETVNAALASINSTGTTITINGDSVICKILGQVRPDVISGTADVTLTKADSGKVYLQAKTSATQTYTLPLASTAKGMSFTFVCMSAASELLINVGTGDLVQLKASEGGASVVTAASTGCKNTAASNVIGDSITLVSDGTTSWIAIQQSGTWATQ